MSKQKQKRHPQHHQNNQKPSEVLWKSKAHQHRGSFVEQHIDGCKSFCAMGLLAHVSGHTINSGKEYQPMADMLEQGYNLKGVDEEQNCPATCTQMHNLPYMMIHLNDAHQWTFGQIAAYLKDRGY